MEAIEFSAKRNSENKIQIPDEFVSLLKPEDKLRIIILIEHNKDEADWRQLSANQFLNGYSEKDSIYDNL